MSVQVIDPPSSAQALERTAFGVHRQTHLHVRRAHVELCSKWTALALLCVAQLMVILDVSIVNVALPSIRRDLTASDAGVVNA